MNYLDFSPFGQLVYEHMSARGWTQTELARRCGLTPGAINKALRGARPVSPTTSDAIAAALVLDTNELRGLAGLPPIRTVETKYDDRIEAVAYRLSRLPEAQLAAVLRQVEHFVSRAEDEARLGRRPVGEVERGQSSQAEQLG